MMVCIDTNVLLQARAQSHPYGVILDACTYGWIDWAVSSSILLEYEEIITSLAGTAAWASMARLINLIDLSGNLMHIAPHFRYQIIANDPDDNAFTDCAITAGADYVITEDRHFAPLANAGFKPQPITPARFIELHSGVYC